MKLGWNRLHATCTWNAQDPISMMTSINYEVVGALIYGGVQLTTATGRDAEMSILPHRSSGLGVYTTGGMMDLCPTCYSGLRRRAPWE